MAGTSATVTTTDRICSAIGEAAARMDCQFMTLLLPRYPLPAAHRQGARANHPHHRRRGTAAPRPRYSKLEKGGWLGARAPGQFGSLFLTHRPITPENKIGGQLSVKSWPPVFCRQLGPRVAAGESECGCLTLVQMH